MKNTHRLAWSLIVLAMGTSAPGQFAATSVPAGRSLERPANDTLVLTNATGQVRVLDSKGLLLENNFVFLPRIPFSALSKADLQAVLETKTAYASLTAFESLDATNARGAVIEHQLQHIWHQGRSLSEKIQTRLEILEDLREYNVEIALLPGSETAASQYAIDAIPINDRLTNRAAAVVAAGAQVDMAEQDRVAGGDAARRAEQQAREHYQETAERVENANDRAMIANGQTVAADQQVVDHLAKVAALSSRLASFGINVSGAPPFSPIAPLTLRAEVDAERTAN